MNKKKWWIALIVILILLAVAMVIYFKFSQSKSFSITPDYPINLNLVSGAEARTSIKITNNEKEFFTGELPSGQYVFGTELIHPDGVAVASTHFVVQEKGVKFGKEEILLTSLILVLILVSLAIFLSIRKYKKVGKMLRKNK